jgi:hypothetical protein
MPTLLLTYNPLTIRLWLAISGILLMLGYLLFRLHVRRVRKARVPNPPSGPVAAPSRPQLFGNSVRPGPTGLVEVGRAALILLALCIAVGFVLIVVPQATVDRLAQSIRIRNGEAPPEERISLLYLGDEGKGKEFHIRGVIRNISTQPIEKLDAMVRLYAGDGNLLETAVIRMDSEIIAPDATATFHLTYPDYSGQIGSYAVDFKLRQGEPLPYKDMRRGS